ncbi:hypothetical protein D3C72_1851710 [compost metagenome]
MRSLGLQQLAQCVQPAFAVRIRQRNALAHLVAAFRAVVIVPLNQRQALGTRQGLTEAGLTAAGHSHDHEKCQ